MNQKYLHVKVRVGAKKESITKTKTGYAVSVREKAERNLANGRVCELLALALGVRKSSIRMVNGHRTSAKLFTIASD